MTTSFVWFVRGNLVASLYVQPMGTVLAILTAAGVIVGVYVACTGRPVHVLLFLIPAKYTVIPVAAFGIAAWAWKIFIHLSGIDGWQ